MQGRSIERSWMDQLIVGGTAREDPVVLLLSLPLTLWTGWERWVDEEFNFLEILNMGL